MMNPSKSYKDLIAWQKSMNLTRLIYEATAEFPKSELFGMVSQMRRASVSVPSNIAEGQARNTIGEFRQFLGIAKGSLAELESLIILAADFNYLNEIQYSAALSLQAEVGKLVNGLLKSLK